MMFPPMYHSAVTYIQTHSYILRYIQPPLPLFPSAPILFHAPVPPVPRHTGLQLIVNFIELILPGIFQRN